MRGAGSVTQFGSVHPRKEASSASPSYTNTRCQDKRRSAGRTPILGVRWPSSHWPSTKSREKRHRGLHHRQHLAWTFSRHQERSGCHPNTGERDGAMIATRARLPNRRTAETFELEALARKKDHGRGEPALIALRQGRCRGAGANHQHGTSRRAIGSRSYRARN